jgi:hypothetical protein
MPIFNKEHINDVELFSGAGTAPYELIQGSLRGAVVRTRPAGGYITLRKGGTVYPARICQCRFAGIMKNGSLEINGQTYTKIK